MATIEEEIKQKKFQDELLKANVNLLYTANWLYNRISAHLKQYGLTHEQFNVLRILRGSHPRALCQKDVLSRMIAPNSNLTLIVRKLSAKKLLRVTRSAKDKREYQINITAAGLKLVEKIDRERKDQQLPMNQLSVSEAFHLNALLDKMRSE